MLCMTSVKSKWDDNDAVISTLDQSVTVHGQPRKPGGFTSLVCHSLFQIYSQVLYRSTFMIGTSPRKQECGLGTMHLHAHHLLKTSLRYSTTLISTFTH